MAMLNNQMVYIYGGFHSHGGTPIAGWFTMENPMKVVDLGVALFQETSMSLPQKWICSI